LQGKGAYGGWRVDYLIGRKHGGEFGKIRRRNDSIGDDLRKERTKLSS